MTFYSGFVPSGITNPQFTPQSQSIQPPDLGQLAWAAGIAPTNVTAANILLVAGVMNITSFYNRSNISATKLSGFVSVIGATLTAGQNLIGLYGPTGNLIVSSGDMSAVWTVAGLYTTAFTTGVLVPGTYYVGFLANGSTAPTLRAINANVGLIANVQTVVNPSQFTSSTSGSALPLLHPYLMRSHGITHFDPDNCFGCRVKTLQIQPAPTFQPHFNYSVGQHVNTKREYLDALNRCADANSEITGTEHRYEPRYPGETAPIREADGVLEDRARNLTAIANDKPLPVVAQ